MRSPGRTAAKKRARTVTYWPRIGRCGVIVNEAMGIAGSIFKSADALAFCGPLTSARTVAVPGVAEIGTVSNPIHFLRFLSYVQIHALSERGYNCRARMFVCVDGHFGRTARRKRRLLQRHRRRGGRSHCFEREHHGFLLAPDDELHAVHVSVAAERDALRAAAAGIRRHRFGIDIERIRSRRKIVEQETAVVVGDCGVIARLWRRRTRSSPRRCDPERAPNRK